MEKYTLETASNGVILQGHRWRGVFVFLTTDLALAQLKIWMDEDIEQEQNRIKMTEAN
jgi:hypothetical protein